MQSRAARGSLVANSIIVLGLLLAAASPASGGEESLGTVQLRGGYDANPTGLPGKPQGSSFVTAAAAVAIGRDYVGGKVAFAAEGQYTRFAAPDIAPAHGFKLALKTEHDLDTGWSLRTSLRADNAASYDTRALNIVDTIKLRPQQGAFRPFITGELRYSTLNETNILLGDFMPEPQRFVRGTAIPGVAIVHRDLEFGVSASIAMTRTIGGEDPLGFHRDDTRIQPFLFANYDGETFDFAASVSRFNARWKDERFEPMQETLYDVSIGKTFGAFKLGLMAKRSVEDTTFPFVPVALMTAAGATLSYKATPQLTLRASAKALRAYYIGVDLSSDTTALGLGASYAYGGGWTLGLEAARVQGRLIDGESMTGAVISFSLTKAFTLAQHDTTPASERRTALPPPAGQW